MSYFKVLGVLKINYIFSCPHTFVSNPPSAQNLLCLLQMILIPTRLSGGLIKENNTCNNDHYFTLIVLYLFS